MKICDELRQAVLQAAIQGKLTRQHKEDGDARDLLKQIEEEKAQLIKEKKIKNDKSLLPVSEEELLEIPDTWACVRVGKAFNLQAGKNINSSEISQIYTEGSYPCFGGNGLRGYVKKYNTEGHFPIIGRQGALCGNINLAYGKFYATEHAVVVTVFAGINSNFVALFMEALNFNQYATATAQPGLSVAKIDTVVFPLPPLAEQQRIVAKVDKLMAEIDELEKVENELIALKEAFPGDMKAALLQAAMQGKLTTQRKEDGNAKELLKQITEEKARLVKEGKLKKEKPLAEIGEDEIPFDIPENWEWVRLSQIVYNNGQAKPEDKFCYIDIGSIDNKNQRLASENNVIEASKAPSRARKIVKFGDILYSTVRPYLHNMCIIDREFPLTPIASTGFAVLSCFEGILNSYLFRCLMSPSFDDYANDNENSKGVAYPAINDEKLYKALIPLPPLAEQERIVAKLDKLLPLVDGLVEAQLMYDSLKETLQTGFGKTILAALITALGKAIYDSFSAWCVVVYLVVVILIYWRLRIYDKRRTEKQFNQNLNDYLNMMK